MKIQKVATIIKITTKEDLFGYSSHEAKKDFFTKNNLEDVSLGQVPDNEIYVKFFEGENDIKSVEKLMNKFIVSLKKSKICL